MNVQRQMQQNYNLHHKKRTKDDFGSESLPLKAVKIKSSTL